MADLVDVQNALLNSLSAVLFSGAYSEGTGAASILPGNPVIALYRGWPDPEKLDKSLAAGTSHVTIFTDPGAARLTSRYEWVWQTAAQLPTTLQAYASATPTGQSVTVYGTCNASQMAGILIGSNLPVVYQCGASDTPATVATALANQLSSFSPSVNGSVISFPFTVAQNLVQAQTGSVTTGYLETRRQEQVFRLTVWCPTPALRDLISETIDSTMAYTRRFTFPDSTVSNVPLYRGTYVDDATQTQNLWRRDLRYAIEYPTILAQTQYPLLFPHLVVTANADADTNEATLDNLIISSDSISANENINGPVNLSNTGTLTVPAGTTINIS